MSKLLKKNEYLVLLKGPNGNEAALFPVPQRCSLVKSRGAQMQSSASPVLVYSRSNAKMFGLLLPGICAVLSQGLKIRRKLHLRSAYRLATNLVGELQRSLIDPPP